MHILSGTVKKDKIKSDDVILTAAERKRKRVDVALVMYRCGHVTLAPNPSQHSVAHKHTICP